MRLYKTFDVIPEDGSWLLRTAEEPRVPRRHDQKREAIQEAVRLALEDRPSEVVVHSGQGLASQCVIFDVQDPDVEEDLVELGPIAPSPPSRDGRARDLSVPKSP